MFKLFQKLKHCGHALVAWQKNGEVNSAQKINQLEQTLANLKSQGDEANKEEILTCEKKLLEEYQLEEKYWREKSRVKWLKWRDQNTKILSF